MESEIRKETAAFVAALARGDAAAAADGYTDAATLIVPGAGQIQGKAGIHAYWQAGVDVGLLSLTFEHQRLEEIAGVVLEVGRYAVSGRGGTDSGTHLVLHTLGGATWRRAAEVFSPDSPKEES